MPTWCEVTREMRQDLILRCFRGNHFSKSMGLTLGILDVVCWNFCWKCLCFAFTKETHFQQCSRWSLAKCSVFIILSSMRWHLDLVLFQFAKYFPGGVSIRLRKILSFLILRFLAKVCSWCTGDLIRWMNEVTWGDPLQLSWMMIPLILSSYRIAMIFLKVIQKDDVMSSK